jgi:hypothetical protein
MRISELRLHPVAIADAPLRSSYGLHAPYALRTIVELKTTDGLTGIGETYGGDGPLAALEGVREMVTGMDPFDLTRFWQHLGTPGRAPAIAARPSWFPAKTRSTNIPAHLPQLRSPVSTSSDRLLASLSAISPVDARATKRPFRPTSFISTAVGAAWETMPARTSTARVWIRRRWSGKRGR